MSNLQGTVSGRFESFSANRQKCIEPKWRDAYNVFNRIVSTNKDQKSGEGEGWRSDAYLGTTRQKIVAAAAIVVDTMLQGGRINYVLQTSGLSREALEEAGFPEAFYEDNKEKMEALIDDQLSWAQADLSMRKGILSAATYGETYAKIVVDEHTRAFFRMIQDTVSPEVPDALRFEYQKEVSAFPKWEHLSVWDCFTDLEDRNPRTNLGFFHRSYARKEELKRLMRADETGVIQQNVKKVLDASDEATPDKSATVNPKLENLNTTFHNLRLLDYYGRVKVSELKTYLANYLPDMLEEFEFSDDEEDSNSEIDAHILMAGTGNEIIRITPIDDVLGRPVFYVPWEDDTDDAVKATGVADNCMNTQHILNSIFRAVVDNQKLSGNALLGVKEEFLADDVGELVPGKKIRLDPNCPDIRQAIQNFQVQDISGGQIQVFGLVAQMLEEDSNIPKIQQGMDTRRDETAFSVAQRLEKSGKYFGQIVRNFDDGFVEQIIQYMYHYNMLDPDVTQGKGDYDVQALGFSSFQDKVTRLNGLRQFFEIALSHPEVFEKLKLENLFREFARMLDLDPEQVTFSEEEIAAQKAQEAQEAQVAQEQAQIEMEQKQAAIRRDNSQATINTVHANKANEELKMAQREAVREATNPDLQEE